MFVGKDSIVSRIAWISAGIVSTVSIIEGFCNAALESKDFQWSGTRLILHHIDPWGVALRGNADGSILLSQYPSYVHFLYLLLAPLGAMSFPVARLAWAFLNLFLAGLTLWLVKRLFQLSRMEWGILCAAFLCGTPFRNSLGNGQTSLLVLAFVALAYGARTDWSKSIWFGLSYCKYSFAPPYFFDLMVSGSPLLLLLSLVPTAIGVVWVHWMVGGSWMHLIAEPLLIVGVSEPGDADLMSLADRLFAGRHAGGSLFFIIKCAVPLLLALALAWYIRNRLKLRGEALAQTAAAVYGVAALLLFRHIGYDQVFLVFALAFALKHHRQKLARPIVVCIAWFWFLLRFEFLMPAFASFYMVLFNAALLALICYWLLKISQHGAGLNQVPAMTEQNTGVVHAPPAVEVRGTVIRAVQEGYGPTCRRPRLSCI